MTGWEASIMIWGTLRIPELRRHLLRLYLSCPPHRQATRVSHTCHTKKR